MPQSAEIRFNGKTATVPLIKGTEGELGLDITRLRDETGLITLDPAFANTGACTSAVTFIDGEKGILRYRGIPIEELAEKSSFIETAYLLIYGRLPNKTELDTFTTLIVRHTMLHEDMKNFFSNYALTAHPMAILSAMVCSLSSYYPESLNPKGQDGLDLTIARLIAKVPTIAAYSYKKSIGQPFVYPQNHLSYAADFIHMMFAVPAEPYTADPVVERALNVLLILHADHEQNCSTSTVRLVGSSHANLFASIAAGVCALWGRLHGGANAEVMEMLELIRQDGGGVKKYIAQVKDKKTKIRLMGFGHRVYKNYDPRAKIIKSVCRELLEKLNIDNALLDIARELEEAALSDPYFIERKLYPNVDFYSGIIYHAMGIPTNMFTVMFALGRLPGWIAHWREMRDDPEMKIGRPRQIYTGPTLTTYIPLGKRK
ncbi:MAG: citrate synthase [Elusimicrobia bacterium]|nr:citrate synthase [Elusimicrobiota bacterium]